jgi:hypothetical protein
MQGAFYVSKLSFELIVSGGGWGGGLGGYAQDELEGGVCVELYEGKAGATRNRHPFSQQDSPFSLSLFPSSTTQKIGILIPESNRPESPL